jgi:putative transposase
LIRTTYYESERTYGSPRIYKAIKAAKVPCSRDHVAKIMQQEHIWAVHKRKFRVTTDSEHGLPVAENLLARDFTANRPNEKWVSDITYIRTKEGWLYLAVIIELFSRKVVGWSMKPDMKTHLLLEALAMAIRARKPEAGLIHHSDRGVQYAIFRASNGRSAFISALIAQPIICKPPANYQKLIAQLFYFLSFRR